MVTQLMVLSRPLPVQGGCNEGHYPGALWDLELT